MQKVQKVKVNILLIMNGSHQPSLIILLTNHENDTYNLSI